MSTPHGTTSEQCGCHQTDPGHDHGGLSPHKPPDSGTRLLLTLALNLFIPVAQVAGGLYANSVALISDAAHNFSDFVAVLIAYFAYRIGQKGATLAYTFGYQRAEVLAALINVALLVGASLFIISEAVQRFLDPQPVAGVWVMALAGVGIVGNGFSAWLLHRDSARSLNVRGAFLHMMGDLLTSVVVLINGAILMVKPWYWLDPVLSLFIVLFILKNGWGILREATGILMNAAPKTVDIARIRRFLQDIPQVENAHYLHAWQIGSEHIAFSAHIVVQDQPVSRTELLAQNLKEKLLHRFGIDHTVFQFETTSCGQGGLLCEEACAPPDIKPEVPSPSNGGWRQKWILPGLRILLGGIFIWASVDKILRPEAFAQAVYNYQILPDSLVNLCALILPWLELMLGACLVFGIWVPGALTLINLLMLVFMGALIFNLARGLDIHCGCFSVSPESGAGTPFSMVLSLIRDGLFLILGLFLWVRMVRKESNDN